MRRITGVIAAALGMGLIAVPFALSLFSRTSSAEQVTDRFRHMMSEEGLVELRTSFETVRLAGEGLTWDLMPQLAIELGMSQAELDRFLESEFPAVATGLRELPGVLAFVAPVIDGLEDNADEFRQADALPFGKVPITVGPWVFIGIGTAFLVAGGLVLTGRRWSLVSALLLGVAVAAAPLVVSVPQKASAGDRVALVSRPGLSQGGADAAQGASVVVDAMFAEIENDFLPALEQELGLSAAELQNFLATDFPAVSEGLARWEDEISPKAHSLADKQTASVEDFAEADRVPFTTLPWLLVGAGAVLAGLAGAALVRPRRQPATPAIDLDAPTSPSDVREPEEVMS